MAPVKFFAISDFGAPTPQLKSVAKAMNEFALNNGGVDMIFGLGDNFYPSGVSNIHDKQFKKTWREIFIQYPSLQVPWKMILGNHDYMDNPIAQIDYTTSKYNEDGLWQLPDFCYEFSCPLDEDGNQMVDFFGLDSNACQDHVATTYPELRERMHRYVTTLSDKLTTSNARWKIVFAHHPLYTKGMGHSYPATCLREDVYTKLIGTKVIERQGYNLEKTLVAGQVDLYLAGHEHVFQHHHAKGVHHVCCGASGADIRYGSGFYHGMNEEQQITWHGRGDQIGFVYGEIDTNSVRISFINAADNSVIHQVVIEKPTDCNMDTDESCTA